MFLAFDAPRSTQLTEIPEHLLKRSRERRAAAGLPAEGGPNAGASTPSTSPSVPAAATPATRPPPPPAPAVAAPPKPLPPFVVAANNRKKIPFWAMPILALLPLWGFMYIRSVTPVKPVVTGPLGTGATVYANCASCHGSGGEGGTGYQLSNGSVLKTFPKIEDQIRFVYNGTNAYDGKPYGDPARGRIGHVKGLMPAWGSSAGGALTDVEILGVICHERFTLAGADPVTANKPEWDTYCSPEAPKWLAVEAGGFTAADIVTTPTA